MAGGLNVGVNLISKSSEIFPDNNYVALCPNKKEYKSLTYENLQIIFVPDKYKKSINKLIINFWIKKNIREIKPDVVFNLCNIPLSINIKQLTLLHWAYAVYPESKVWAMMSFRERIIRNLKLFIFKYNISKNSNLTVQTDVMKNRLKEIYKLDKVYLVPNSINIQFKNEDLLKQNKIFKKNDDNLYFIYPTRYYPHKNIEILIDVAKLIKKDHSSLKILLTLDESEKNVKKIKKQIIDFHLEDIIINVGRLSYQEVCYMYKRSDAVIIPTLLESLGLPFLEAMSFNKPLFTSNLDFSRSLCGDYPVFFNPFSSLDIYEKMQLIHDKSYIKEKTILSDQVLNSYTNSWKEVVESYNKILKNI